MCTKVNGYMIKLKASVHKETIKEVYILVTGSTINKMDLAKKNGQTAHSMRVNIKMVKNMVKE